MHRVGQIQRTFHSQNYNRMREGSGENGGLQPGAEDSYGGCGGDVLRQTVLDHATRVWNSIKLTIGRHKPPTATLSPMRRVYSATQQRRGLNRGQEVAIFRLTEQISDRRNYGWPTF